MFTGPVPNFMPLEHLHYVSLKGHQLEGTLTLPRRVQARTLTADCVAAWSVRSVLCAA